MWLWGKDRSLVGQAAAIVRNALVPALYGEDRSLEARPQFPAAAALTTSVPELPAFAADFAQHATDGGHDLIR